MNITHLDEEVEKEIPRLPEEGITYHQSVYRL
jgi:hypothetical protein